MRTSLTAIAAAIIAVSVTGCSQPEQKDNTSANPGTESTTPAAQTAPVTTPAEEPAVEVAKTESDRANELFEQIFMDSVMRSPIYQTYLGIKKDYGKWDDLSEERAIEDLELTKQNLQKLDGLKFEELDQQTRISFELMRQNLVEDIEDFKWRHHNYPVNQMYGTHSSVPSLLINQHQITSADDALAYISRLNGLVALFDQLITQLQTREDKGVMAPKFVYAYVISDSKNIIQGAPFDDGDDSTLLADFKRKVEKLELSDEQKHALVKDAVVALKSSVKPAYESLIAFLTAQESRANTVDGAWKFPEGNTFYNNALERTTTTKLTAEEIHDIGLSEVARIHDEMREIMKKVEFEGDLQAFFEFMRTDQQFYYVDSEDGRQAYLDEATKLIDIMKSRLDELFLTKPEADLVVKRVEPFREKSAGKAFYQRPAPDGSRPGYYYANLYRMSDMPTYQMEALAYHEGIPGHHMQLAISQQLEGIPKFRKFGGYTAHTEGWGLYSELLPKEIGFYSDPYSDFGRLAMELWRACRLVVDTGIHNKKWTRQQAIDYLIENTPNPEGDVVKAIERYIVMPSQATAYKIGMLKILELREKAQQKLGDKFDIREFHDVILKNGPLPLNVLERMMDDYIAETLAS